MKNKAKVALCIMLAAVSILLCCACKKNGADAESGGGYYENGVSAEGIVGVWYLPESELIVAGKRETWEFTSDGKYYHRQLDSDGGVLGTVDGTYTIEADKLNMTVSGWVQPEMSVSFPDSSTMVCTTAEKSITLKRA